LKKHMQAEIVIEPFQPDASGYAQIWSTKE
jgi:hypothetical protein